MGATPANTNAAPLHDDVAATVDGIMARYSDRTGLVLNTLNDVQDHYRYLPEEALERIAENTQVSLDDLKQMGAFFDYLSLNPTGRYLIEVCDGTCCHMLGAVRLMAEFERELGIPEGGMTTDGMISLKAVSCVGACGIAPVVLSEGRVFGRVKITDVGNVAKLTRDLGT